MAEEGIDLKTMFSFEDLLYAINRLIEMEKTTAAEVLTYICEYNNIDLKSQLWEVLSSLLQKNRPKTRPGRQRHRPIRRMPSAPVPAKNEVMALRGKFGGMLLHMTPKQKIYWKATAAQRGLKNTVNMMVRKYG